MNPKRFVRSVAKKSLAAAGWSLTPVTKHTLQEFLRSRGIDTIFDVGANVGQYGRYLRNIGYRGLIVSFEPVRSVFDQLQAEASADANWKVFNCALGTEAGEAEINVSEMSVFSSLRTLSEAATKFDQAAKTQRTESIVVKTLDAVAREFAASQSTFLKIDTQGFERAVLAGGTITLPKLSGVQMELPIVHLYEDVWSFSEAVEFMSDSGFVPAQIHPVNLHSKDDVSIVEVDCIFRRRSPLLD